MKASLAKDRCFSRGPGVCVRVVLGYQEVFQIQRKIIIFSISPLHPYYSRDYRSTSHMEASLAKDRCFSSGPGVCFQVVLRCQEGFSDL